MGFRVISGGTKLTGNLLLDKEPTPKFKVISGGEKTAPITEPKFKVVSEPKPTPQFTGKPKNWVAEGLKKTVSDIGQGFADVPAQVQDLLTMPARVLGTPHPPMVSKLATQINEPVADFNLPVLTPRNIKPLFTGKFKNIETTPVSPSILDIGLNAAAVGGPLLGNIRNSIKFNQQLRQQLAKPIIENILRGRAGAIDVPGEVVTPKTELPLPKPVEPGKALVPVQKPIISPLAPKTLVPGLPAQPESIIPGKTGIVTPPEFAGKVEPTEEGDIEYHGTTPENAQKILKEGKFKVGPGQAGVSTTQGYEEALDYANGNSQGVIAVRVKKGATMAGKEGVDFLTGTGSFKPEDVTPLQIGKPQPTEGKVSESLYHETSVSSLRDLMSTGDASGLNVSDNPNLALGQGGKGVKIEFDKSKLLGSRGSLGKIKKPGLPLSESMGLGTEYRLIGGETGIDKISKITLEPGTKIDKVTQAILQRQFNAKKLENGGWEFTPKLSTQGKVTPQEEMVTLYHASPNLPTEGKWRKGTMFADTEQNARYYAESHHEGNIEVQKVTLPKSLVEKNKSNNIHILKEEYPISTPTGEGQKPAEGTLFDNPPVSEYRVSKMINGEYGIFKADTSDLVNSFKTEEEAYKFIDNPTNNLLPKSTKPTIDIKKTISENISKSELEQAAERFWNVNGKDFYTDFSSAKEWLQKEDPAQVALELENFSGDLYRAYFNRFSKFEYPNEIQPQDVVEAYQEGILPDYSVSPKEKIGNLNIENIPAKNIEVPWSPKQAKDIEAGKVFEKATQRLTKVNKEEVLKSRGDLITLYNTDPELAIKLGLKKGELSRKIKTLTGYPSGAPKLEYALNQGIPDEFKWVGISNSSWINKNTIDPNSIDKYFKSIKTTAKGKGFYGNDGEYLRRYIINAILGIDTRLLFNDLSFIIESLEKARGNYSNSNLTITISEVNPNTVAHEIGHYLDYKFAREFGLSNDTLSRATPNWELFKERGMPEEHIKWAQKFKEFANDIWERGDLRSEYTQDVAEVFARFVAKFTSWVNKQATAYPVRDEDIYGGYADKFQESDFTKFVRLLQEKAYIDAKFGIKVTTKKTSGNINMDLGMSSFDKRNEIMQKRLTEVSLAKEELQSLNAIRNQLRGRIQKYRGAYLKEELGGIPRFYITTQQGIKPDEIIEEINNSNFGVQLQNEQELKDWLIGLEKRRKELVTRIETNRPGLEAHKESTLLAQEGKIRQQEIKKFTGQAKKAAEEAAKITTRLQGKAFREGKATASEQRKVAYFGQQISKEERSKLYLMAKEKGLYYTDFLGRPHDILKNLLKFYREASFDQLREYISNLTGDPENPPKLFKLFGEYVKIFDGHNKEGQAIWRYEFKSDITKDTEVIKFLKKVSDNWVDINKVEAHISLDLVRIVEKVTQQDSWENNILADNTFNVFAAADEAMYDRLVKENAELEIGRQGIKKGSKESAELMRKSEAGKPLTEKEQKSATFFRNKFDSLINEMNDMRMRLGKKPIPYLKNYWTHITETPVFLTFEIFKLEDKKNASLVTTAQLDAIRKGDYTKGNMPFNKFAQHRLGEKTEYDAVGNFEIYLKTALKEIYYTPAITHARKFIEYALVRQPNAYMAIDRALNDLKGKTTYIDNGGLGPILSSWPIKKMRSLIAKSALLGNLNFWIMNSSNFVVSYDELGNYMNKGMAKFLGTKKWRQFAFKNSNMLKGRTIDPDVDPGSFKTLEAALGYITNLLEYNNVGSTFVGAYFKGIDQGFSQSKAIKYADAIARRTQVGYKKYELNAWMRSNSGMFLSQFQTWTFNAMNHLIYDLKLGNIPGNLVSKFTGKGKKPVRWGAFFTLVVISMLVNYMYKKAGLREPYGPESAVPRIPGIGGAVPPIIRVGQNIVSAVTSKRPETRQKAALRAVTSFVPAGTQVNRFFQGKVFPTQPEEKQTVKFPSKFKSKFPAKFKSKLK